MKHFSEQERYYIELYLKQGYTPYKISVLLGRSDAAVYYEIKKGTVEFLDKNLKPYKKYCADYAIRISKERQRKQGRSFAISGYTRQIERLEHLIIKEKYSCYCALEIVKNEYPDFNLCVSTLYNYINRQVFPHLRRYHLLYDYKPRQQDSEKRISKKNRKGTSIELRPDNINNRDSFGHWEMDSVCSGRGCSTTLLVFSERMTRLELIFKVPEKSFKSTLSVLDFLEKKYQSDFCNVFKSITCDNGMEFINHELMQRSIFDENIRRTQIYYCHPYCSSERGTNENQNKLIRRFIPKGSNISKYDDTFIRYIQDYMNNMPRKIFNGRTALQLANECGFV